MRHPRLLAPAALLVSLPALAGPTQAFQGHRISVVFSGPGHYLVDLGGRYFSLVDEGREVVIFWTSAEHPDQEKDRWRGLPPAAAEDAALVKTLTGSRDTCLALAEALHVVTGEEHARFRFVLARLLDAANYQEVEEKAPAAEARPVLRPISPRIRAALAAQERRYKLREAPAKTLTAEAEAQYRRLAGAAREALQARIQALSAGLPRLQARQVTAGQEAVNRSFDELFLAQVIHLFGQKRPDALGEADLDRISQLAGDLYGKALAAHGGTAFSLIEGQLVAQDKRATLAKDLVVHARLALAPAKPAAAAAAAAPRH